MMLDPKQLRVCNCNRTMQLDATALAQALGATAPITSAPAPITIHTELCRKQVEAFGEVLDNERCIVACTQEAPLFSELAAQAGAQAELKFVNIRETAGWSAEGSLATPKIAALLALAAMPEPEPVASVSYQSGGQVLIIGSARASIEWAERLAGELQPSVLLTDTRGGELPIERRYPIRSGRVASIAGYLGAFEVRWTPTNPIDLDICTRCNACIRVCPEQAIDFSYQIDLDRCTGHRACVKACGEVRAIDFDRIAEPRSERFDLILDLSASPLLDVPQKPQGYFAPGADPLEQALIARELAQMVGEFEKPKFFAYNEKICAHGRSGKIGCTACIEVCSTRAISADGDKVRVEPHLCMGCGGCATVCPSGAMTHVMPRVADLGARLKRALGVFHAAGGRDAAILFHNGSDGRALIASLARRGKGLPARVIPIEIHHIASIGIDLMLGAFAYGATQVLALAAGAEAAEYGAALDAQMGYAETIVQALGYRGEHFKLLRVSRVGEVSGASDWRQLEAKLWTLGSAQTVAKAAIFNLSNDKRTTLEFAIEHIAKLAPTPREEIPLAMGAPYGRVEVNQDTCTLCKACIGACPESALIDSQDAPRLKFIERNCVQCGLCEVTCPEDAITLHPRLLLTPQVKEAVTLNEAEPFHCIRCAKPFGTRAMIANMLGRLGTHSMFATGEALKRLKMCADCRVVDMMDNKAELSIFDVKR